MGFTQERGAAPRGGGGVAGAGWFEVWDQGEGPVNSAGRVFVGDVWVESKSGECN